MADAETYLTEMTEYAPLDKEGTSTYEQYKNRINEKVRETFPSIPSDFDLKPVTYLRTLACGTIYHYKFALPDNKYATVSFIIGGLPMGLPDGQNFVSPGPSFTVDPELTSTPN